MKNLLLLIVLVFAATSGFTQTPLRKIMPGSYAIGSGALPDPATSTLQLNGVTSGFLMNRLTTVERDAIVTPVAGLEIFNTTAGKVQTYDGAAWVTAGLAFGPYVQGSILFGTPVGIAEDNTNLFWDDTNKLVRLGSGVADLSSIFEVFSTTKGSRPCPVMTEVQRDAIGTPAIGLCVFNTTSLKENLYNGTSWTSVNGLSSWVTANAYKIGDIVYESELIYLSLTAHTSGIFVTDLTNNEWVELSKELTTTLQNSYDNSSQPQIVLDGTNNGVQIRDNLTPIGVPLFSVQDNAGSSFLEVSTASILVETPLFHMPSITGLFSLGITTPSTHIGIAGGGGNQSRYETRAYTNNNGAFPSFYFRRSNGSEASPARIFVNTRMGSMQWQAHNGINFISSGRISMFATESFSGVLGGSEMQFYINPPGPTQEILAMTLGSDSSLTLLGDMSAFDIASNSISVTSTTVPSKPFPVMTTVQRDATSPTEGDGVWNTTDTALNFYDGAAWVGTGSGSGGGISAWATATVYAIDDIVRESNKIYKALTNHTSAVFAFDLAANDWIEISASESGISAWLTLADYVTGDLVHEANKIYKALMDHTAGTFSTDLAAGEWVEVSSVVGSVIGTADQVTVTDGIGVVTLSLPQDIATTSSPSFSGLAITSTSNGATPCPVMTQVQRDAIVGAATGQCVYNSTSSTQDIFNGTIWLTPAASGSLNVVKTAGQTTPVLVSALVTDGVSVGTITEDDSGFTSGNCTESSTGDYVCQFTVGFWSVKPHCWAQTTDNNRTSRLLSPTNTSVRFVFKDAGSGGAAASTFYMFCKGNRI